MRIFVTGASGFAGGGIATRLKEAGHTVSGMARSQKSEDKLRQMGITPVSCDLDNIAASHLAGIEVVVHAAAYVSEWGSEAEFHSANVVGTQHVLDASKAAGVQRFIYIGSEIVTFYGQDMDNLDESTPYAMHSHYPITRTKAEAERIVLAANSPSFTTLSIRPRMIWGPGDRTVLPIMMQLVREGKFAWIGHGAYVTTICHIFNLAHAIELALTRGQGGQAYYVTDDETHTLKDFLTQYMGTQGVTMANRSIPKSVARALAYIIEGSWRLFRPGKKPPIVRFVADLTSARCTIKIDKAKRELEYRPIISMQEGMRTMPKLTAEEAAVKH